MRPGTKRGLVPMGLLLRTVLDSCGICPRLYGNGDPVRQGSGTQIEPMEGAGGAADPNAQEQEITASLHPERTVRCRLPGHSYVQYNHQSSAVGED